MRAFFILTILFAVLVGWTAGRHRLPPAPPGNGAQSVSVRPVQTIPGTIDLRRNSHGHFTIDGYANAAPLNFVVDTGASAVALGRKDAERAGLHVADSDFDGEARTASGTIRVAHVTLDRLRVAEIQLTDVSAFVLDVPDAMPLLGQSFLDRIDKVAIEGDRMTLTKR